MGSEKPGIIGLMLSLTWCINWAKCFTCLSLFFLICKGVIWAKSLPFLRYSSHSCLEVGAGCFIKVPLIWISSLPTKKENNGFTETENSMLTSLCMVWQDMCLEDDGMLSMKVKCSLRCGERWSYRDSLVADCKMPGMPNSEEINERRICGSHCQGCILERSLWQQYWGWIGGGSEMGKTTVFAYS